MGLSCFLGVSLDVVVVLLELPHVLVLLVLVQVVLVFFLGRQHVARLVMWSLVVGRLDGLSMLRVVLVVLDNLLLIRDVLLTVIVHGGVVVLLLFF